LGGRQQLTSLAGAPAGLRRAAVAGSLSLVVPGVGQLLLGERRRGRAMLAVTGLLFLLALWQRSRGVASTVELLVRPHATATLLVGGAALAMFHLYATIDAFRSGFAGAAPRPRQRSGMLGTAGVLVSLSVATVAPHVVAANYVLVLDETLEQVFADRNRTTTSGDGVTAADREPSRPGVELADAGRWLEKDRFSVAVLGSDAHPTRTGARLDALLVVSVDPGAGRTTVFSIERHLRDFPLTGRFAELWEDHCRGLAQGWELLNALYRCGDEVLVDEVAALHPDAPDPAAAAVAGALGELLDLPIDHYVMVDMQGFVALVDAFGGIRLDLDGTVPAGGCDWQSFDIQPGSDELDGKAALELVRERDGTSSADRMGRQRCLIAAVAQEVETSALLWRFGSVTGVLREHLATSLPMDELPNLIALLGHLDHDEVRTVGFERPDYVSPDGRPRVEEIRAAVQRALDGPTLAAHRRAR
jgi:polyisoprenyl-teichoic acid--peptidoglycan teichoic acid transferase